MGAELQSARGGPFKLSDYTGQVLVVNLWATWVAPSRLEAPSLMKLQKDYWSRGVRVVGLSTENPRESRALIREYMRNFRIQYKIGWVTADVAKTLFQERDAVPQTYVISPSGRIVRRFVGFNPTVTPPLVRKAVDEALAE